MLMKPFRTFTPCLHPTVRAAETVTVIGQVTAAANVSLWYGCVLRGDEGPITVGENTNIQDNSVVHNMEGMTTVIGKNVVVDHNAILHSCTVGDNCLIGMGAILLNGSVIGEGSIVGAGSVVTENKVFPPNSLLMGTPARVVRTVTPGERAETASNVAAYLEQSREELPLASSD